MICRAVHYSLHAVQREKEGSPSTAVVAVSNLQLTGYICYLVGESATFVIVFLLQFVVLRERFDTVVCGWETEVGDQDFVWS